MVLLDETLDTNCIMFMFYILLTTDMVTAAVRRPACHECHVFFHVLFSYSSMLGFIGTTRCLCIRHSHKETG